MFYNVRIIFFKIFKNFVLCRNVSGTVSNNGISSKKINHSWGAPWRSISDRNVSRFGQFKCLWNFFFNFFFLNIYLYIILYFVIFVYYSLIPKEFPLSLAVTIIESTTSSSDVMQWSCSLARKRGRSFYERSEYKSIGIIVRSI